MAKKPERPSGGWKIHEKQLQDLYDWINRERLVDAPGLQETPFGKRITKHDFKFNPQFSPFFNKTDSYTLQLGIKTGYVYAPYDSGSSTHLQMLHRFPLEPKIGPTLLSASTSPVLTLEPSATNHIFLELTWGVFTSAIGGWSHESSHAFKVDTQVTGTANTGNAGGHSHGGYTSYENSHTHGGGSVGSGSTAAGESHRHTITAESDHYHTIPSLTVGTGYLKVNKRTYYLTDAEFITQTSATPPTETSTVTNMLAGWIKLDANGEVDTSSNDGFRWFLEGAIHADKAPDYVTGETSPSRTEPVAPIAASGQTIPGA